MHTLSVVVPAFNESANIIKLLNSILEQNDEGYDFEKLFVVSDGSRDNTANLVRSIIDKRIVLIEHTEQKGKSIRLKEIFELNASDILVQFDADVKLDSNNLLSLTAQAFESSSPDLLSFNVAPVKPTTFVEKIAHFSISYWRDALDLLGDKALLHRSIGAGRAFSKNFAKKLDIPPDATVGEDVFTYLFARKYGFKIEYAPQIKVWYRPPTNIKDYVKQMRRFLNTPAMLGHYFGPTAFNEENHMNSAVRLKAYLRNVLKYSPIIVGGHLILQLYAKYSKFDDRGGVGWDSAMSTKSFDEI